MSVDDEKPPHKRKSTHTEPPPQRNPMPPLAVTPSRVAGRRGAGPAQEQDSARALAPEAEAEEVAQARQAVADQAAIQPQAEQAAVAADAQVAAAAAALPRAQARAPPLAAQARAQPPPQPVYLSRPTQLTVLGEGDPGRIQYDATATFTTLEELEAEEIRPTFNTVLCLEILSWKRAKQDDSVGFKGNARGGNEGKRSFSRMLLCRDVMAGVGSDDLVMFLIGAQNKRIFRECLSLRDTRAMGE